jgi:hypothetical protein
MNLRGVICLGSTDWKAFQLTITDLEIDRKIHDNKYTDINHTGQ